MKLSVSNIVAASLIFSNNKYAKADMDINVALWFLRNGKALSEVHELFEVKRTKVFEEFAINKEIPDNKLEAFRNELTGYLIEEVDIEVCMITTKALRDIKISPADLSVIMFAISE